MRAHDPNMRLKVLDYLASRNMERDRAEEMADMVLWCAQVAKDQPVEFREALERCATAFHPDILKVLFRLARKPNESLALN